MKKNIYKLILVSLVLAPAMSMMALGFPQAETLENAFRVKIDEAQKVKALEKKKAELEKKKEIEDKKRDKFIPGVAIEEMEKMNDAQDSICLSIRSEIVDVELEIKENSTPEVNPQLIDGYRRLNENIYSAPSSK